MDDEFEMPQGDDVGIILHPHLKSGNEMPLDLLRKWKEEGKRMVTVHFYYPHLHIPYVIVDNFVGGYLATEHLIRS
ncbi:LacI family transcriptional regulator [Paenibacillus taihuensis]|nr:LacI family transcriptional regulator [Paenibacillus taihuensis]